MVWALPRSLRATADVASIQPQGHAKELQRQPVATSGNV